MWVKTSLAWPIFILLLLFLQHEIISGLFTRVEYLSPVNSFSWSLIIPSCDHMCQWQKNRQRQRGERNHIREWSNTNKIVGWKEWEHHHQNFGPSFFLCCLPIPISAQERWRCDTRWGGDEGDLLPMDPSLFQCPLLSRCISCLIILNPRVVAEGTKRMMAHTRSLCYCNENKQDRPDLKNCFFTNPRSLLSCRHVVTDSPHIVISLRNVYYYQSMICLSMSLFSPSIFPCTWFTYQTFYHHYHPPPLGCMKKGKDDEKTRRVLFVCVYWMMEVPRDERSDGWGTSWGVMPLPWEPWKIIKERAGEKIGLRKEKKARVVVGEDDDFCEWRWFRGWIKREKKRWRGWMNCESKSLISDGEEILKDEKRRKGKLGEDDDPAWWGGGWRQKGWCFCDAHFELFSPLIPSHGFLFWRKRGEAKMRWDTPSRLSYFLLFVFFCLSPSRISP